MALINYPKRELIYKIVYYGTGLGGKTTNLKYIHSMLEPQARGDLITLATESERTLYFDFLPLEPIEAKNGFKARFTLFTVPGQNELNDSRRAILKGVDGIVFVADSDLTRASENASALNNMVDNLKENNLALDQIPLVLQYNKRDLASAMPVERMEKELNKWKVPSYEAVALEGKAVFATLKAISKLIANQS